METAIRETKIHGSIDFPYACFSGRIPEYFRAFPVHWHEYFEIVFIVKGTMKVNINNEFFYPQKGDILIIPPKYIHGFFQEQQFHCFYYTVLFKLEMLEDEINSIIYKKYLLLYEQNQCIKKTWIQRDTVFSNKIFPALTYLIRHRHERYTTNELMVKSKLYELLYCFMEIIDSQSILQGGGCIFFFHKTEACSFIYPQKF